MKCQIQWLDEKTAEPTPDTNEAVCLATCITRRDGVETRQSLPCCAQHRDRMRKMKPWKAVDYYPRFAFLGDTISEWIEEALPECENCGMTGHPLNENGYCPGCLCQRCGKSAFENACSMNDMGWCFACEGLLSMSEEETKAAIASGAVRPALEVKNGNPPGASG